MSESAKSFKVAEFPASWGLASGDLPDVNVWLALSFAAHPFHARATAYWQSACDANTPLWFCRTTMSALVRLLSQPKVMGADVLSLPAATAEAADLRMVTFDKDFERFKLSRLEVLALPA